MIARIRTTKAQLMSGPQLLSEPQSRQADGFTLIELVVVIALLGVVAAVASPMLNSRRVVSTVDSGQTAELLVSTLRMARTTAILNGSPVYVIADSTGFGVWDATGQVLQPKHWYAPGVQAAWTSSTVAFQPTGMSNVSLQVRFTNAIREWRVEVLSGSGQVSQSEVLR